METGQTMTDQLSALASYLHGRREAILRAWRKAIDRDPEMTTGASLPRAQLDDHIPALLDAFEDRDEVDLMAEFAVRLPITVICDLFGLPEEDREDFRQWSLRLVGAPKRCDSASLKMLSVENW